MAVFWAFHSILSTGEQAALMGLDAKRNSANRSTHHWEPIVVKTAIVGPIPGHTAQMAAKRSADEASTHGSQFGRGQAGTVHLWVP
jgi:hypothetical protein